ncbi:MAG: DUF973 family protein [Thermoplasmata archaeon]|nr:DUF973 family protein [Thermoplasmata archaeon]
MAYPTTPGAPAAAAVSRSDIEGVDNLKIASMLGLLVQAMLWAGAAIIYLVFNALSTTATSFGTTSAATIPAWITVNTVYLAFGLVAGGLVIGIVSYVFYYLGFRAIKRGAPDFGAPTTLVLIGLIGFVLIAAGILLILGAIVSAVNDVANGTINSGSAAISLSAIITGGALAALGAILALIGVIGLILGNYRAGTRYEQSTLKIGSILTIIPGVSVVGYVLLLVGYLQAGTKLKSGWAPPTWVQVQVPPPMNPSQPWQVPPPPPPSP